ncbi:MAG: hypothetical protein ACJ0J2_00020 [Dehalococcoidia bacterium]
MKKVFITITLLVFCYSCAVGKTVYLQHPTTGDVVECGGDIAWGNIPAANDNNLQSERYCVQDYKEQGYERVSKDKIK